MYLTPSHVCVWARVCIDLKVHDQCARSWMPYSAYLASFPDSFLLGKI